MTREITRFRQILKHVFFFLFSRFFKAIFIRLFFLVLQNSQLSFFMYIYWKWWALLGIFSLFSIIWNISDLFQKKILSCSLKSHKMKIALFVLKLLFFFLSFVFVIFFLCAHNFHYWFLTNEAKYLELNNFFNF